MYLVLTYGTQFLSANIFFNDLQCLVKHLFSVTMESFFKLAPPCPVYFLGQWNSKSFQPLHTQKNSMDMKPIKKGTLSIKISIYSQLFFSGCFGSQVDKLCDIPKGLESIDVSVRTAGTD